MEVDLISFNKGELPQKLEVKDDLICCEYRPDLMSFVINWQLAKRRCGNHSTKGVSDVSGTTKKPYRQKGTGRARQGSLRSTQFRGGGVTFGPVIRSHSFSVNKKVKALALKSALSLKVSEGHFFALQDVDFFSHKTGDFVAWMKKNCAKSDSSALIVTSKKDKNLSAATSNLFKVKVLHGDAANVYDLMTHDLVFLSHSSIKSLESRLLS